MSRPNESRSAPAGPKSRNWSLTVNNPTVTLDEFLIKLRV